VIYTCYEMVGDCRAGRPEGWAFFVAQYVPVIQKLAAHYRPARGGDRGLIEDILNALRRPETGLFSSIEPAPERIFLAELRQWLLAFLDGSESSPAPDLALELDTLSRALEAFTLMERLVVWLEAMHYEASKTGVMLRMDPHTVEKIRGKAAECLRVSVDHWRRTVLVENGSRLRRAALAVRTPACFPAKAFLDILDGRTVWRGREDMERHAAACWYCVDHFCRMVEVVELLRGLQPLTEQEMESFRAALGLVPPPKRGWKRWFGQSGA
jgi:hypothetical protein